MTERNPNWIGYLRGDKEDISRESIEDLFVCVMGLTDDQGLLLDIELKDILQDWAVQKIEGLRKELK